MVVKPSPKPKEEIVVAMAPTEKTAPTPTPAMKRGSSSEQRGRDLLKEGVKHWKVSTEALQKGNRAEEQRELAASRKLFDQALKHLTEASRKDPGNADLQNMVVDCNRFRYDCLKRTIISLR